MSARATNDGWSRVELGSLLSSRQIKQVLKIMRSSDDSLERVRLLKEFLNQSADQLIARGVLPDYLAYALEYLWSEGRIR